MARVRAIELVMLDSTAAILPAGGSKQFRGSRSELLMNRIAVQVASGEKRRRNLPGTAIAATDCAPRRASRRKCDRGWAMAAVAARMARRQSLAWAFLLAFLLAATGARAQAVFGLQTVGTTSGAQTITVTAQAAGAVSQVEVLTLGVSGLDFAAGGGASTCGSANLAVNGTCTESVTFTPAAPGIRVGAVVLLDGSGDVLATAYLTGTGSGGLGVLIPPNEIIVAGVYRTWKSSEEGIPATTANLDQPASVAIDGAGNLYIADSVHNLIRKVTASTGLISLVAGNGSAAYTGDGKLAVDAALSDPSGVAIDGAGNLYIADTTNNVIRKITAATGIISTVAGNGVPGYGGDGLAATSSTVELNGPLGITVDASGNLYIADTANERIRRVDAATGIIATVAGNGAASPSGNGEGTFSGDGKPAIDAGLSLPYAVAFDSAGDMYIPDSANNRIRKVTAIGGSITASSLISTIAGTGVGADSGDDGPATAADLYSPSGVAVDAAGNVYIADTQNSAIRKVSSATQVIMTIAVNGTGVILANPAAMLGTVALYAPIGIALDSNGNLFVADFYYMLILEFQSNVAVLDFTATPIRVGAVSAPQDQVVENDGNLALDLTKITPDANAAVDDAATTCGPLGTAFLTVDAECVIGAEFAPSVPGDPLLANIDVAGLTPNSPLDIELLGIATSPNSTTIVVTSSLNPSAFGKSVTFTATVTTGATTGNLTGTVSFFDGATTLAANVPLAAPGTTATATFAISTLAVGVHSITATYNNTDDPAHSAATSPVLAQTVLEATATSLTSSLNPSAVGQDVTFTATITASGGGGLTPDGTVTFTDGATTLITMPLPANGVVTYTTAALPQGNNPITATYGGDLTNQIEGSASAVLNQSVLSSSTTVVTSSLNPSTYGTSVTFTATVTPGTGTVAPTGKVNFVDGATVIGTGTLAGNPGAATFTTSALIAGSHTITAAYAGDQNFGPSTSLPITQVVNLVQTATTVAAVPNPGIAGLPVAITATVKAASGAATPTGTVTFADTFNGTTTTLGTATLSAAGTGTINPTLAPGTHSIVATYAGDANNDGSASAPYSLTVNLAKTSTVVTSTPNPSVVESAVTFTATVTGNGGTPTGTVTFNANGTSIGTGTLNGSGVATLSYSGLVAGSYQITAVYGGDTNDSPSTSAAITQVVNKIPTLTDLGSATTTGANPQAILVATVINDAGGLTPTPTGTVTFNNGSTVVGSAPLDSSGIADLVPNLAAGTYSIVAVYSGDALHSPSTSAPVMITVPPSGFNLTVTPATVTIPTTENATITVTLTSLNGFTDNIGLGCASLPAGVTCHFTVAANLLCSGATTAPCVSLAANASPTAQLTIDTNYPLTGGAAAMNSHAMNARTKLAGLLLPFSLVFGWIFWRFRKRHAKVFTLVLVILLSGAAMFVSGCAGISSSNATPGTYVIQVTGTGANSNVIHYQNVTLDITQ